VLSKINQCNKYRIFKMLEALGLSRFMNGFV